MENVDEFFGILRDTGDPNRRQIHVLGKFQLHPKQGTEFSSDSHHDFIGSSNRVHWYRNEHDTNEFMQLADSTPVRFRCDQSYDNPDPLKDRRRVHFRTVKECGAYVVSADECPGWRSGTAKIGRKLPIGTYYLLADDGRSFIGPYRLNQSTEESLLVPKTPTSVKQFDAIVLKAEYFLDVHAHPFLDAIYVISVRDFPTDGTTLDVSTPTQLGNWFVKKLSDLLTESTIKELDAAHPGWRKVLRESLRDGSPGEIQKWEQVSNHLETVLKSAEAISHLRASPAYIETLNREVRSAIAQKKTEIETDAKIAAKAFCDGLQIEIDHLTSRKLKLQNEVVDQQSQLAQPIATFERLKTHLTKDLERLREDCSIVQALFSKDSSTQKSVATTDSVGVLLRSRQSERPVPLKEYFSRRFQPCLSKYQIGLKAPEAQLVLATVLGSRTIVLPDVRWFSAISEALNADAHVFSCDPRWLSWRQPYSAFEPIFSNVSSEHFGFLLVQDFNLALVETWARPLLNVLSGSCDQLPNGHTWPRNIKLFLAPAPNSIGLPLDRQTLGHFSAVQTTCRFVQSLRDSSFTFNGFHPTSMRMPKEVHDMENVGVSTLACDPPTETEILKFPELDPIFGPSLLGVMNDLKRVTHILREFEVDQEEAVASSLKCRCEWISYNSAPGVPDDHR